MTDLNAIVTSLASDVRQQGFAIWPGFLDSGRCSAMSRGARRLAVSGHAKRYPTSTRVWNLYRQGPLFVHLLADSRLDALVTTLLGEHSLLSDYSLNIVNPGQPRDDWHIDYPYNEMAQLVNGSTLGLQCVLALDDFYANNGATQLIPASHLSARRPERVSEATCTVFEAASGSLLVMAAATWHRSGYNVADRSRAAVLLSFVERWVRPMLDPPEPGPWSTSERLQVLLGIRRPPETINGVPI